MDGVIAHLENNGVHRTDTLPASWRQTEVGWTDARRQACPHGTQSEGRRLAYRVLEPATE